MNFGRNARVFWVALSVCALLLGVLAVDAKKARAKGPIRGNSSPWRVQRPISYKNLTIFPIRGQDANLASDYITLDEGIKAGTVVITERGAAEMATYGRRSSVANQTQVAMRTGDGASVNQLALINRSGKKLLLMSGEVIVGGKQDRIVEEDRIISAVSVPVSLNVFCVEHGRWQQRASTTRATGGAAPNVIAPNHEAPKPENFYSLGAVAHPKLRGVAQDKKQQSEVWNEVRANNMKLDTSTGTDTYQAVYASKKVAGTMESYINVLEREVLQPGVIGVVIARNGELVWVDAFASSSLFARYWPKLLKSYVVDAIGDYTSEKQPTIGQAQAYLEDREGGVSLTGQPGVYQLVKTESKQFAVFELRDVALPVVRRIHFNKMQR